MVVGWKKRLFITAFGLAILLVIAISGYFFAATKSQPIYSSKIDHLMFDKKNKPPKYLIILPDNEKLNNIKVINLLETNKSVEKNENDALKNIPLLAKLATWPNQVPLKVIDKQETLKPWATYSKNTNIAPNFNKVVIVVRALGLDTNATQKAIEVLPGEVSLSFSPYAVNAENSIKQARNQGHETYIDLLLAPKDFLKSDHGPKAIDITCALEDNIVKILNTAEINAAIGGFIVSRGIGDEIVSPRMGILYERIKQKGFLIVDASGEEGIRKLKTQGLAKEEADIIIDNQLNREYIQQQLAEAEKIALEKGKVLIVVTPKPVVMFEILEWVKTFSTQHQNYEEFKKNENVEKPFALAPLSAIVGEE